MAIHKETNNEPFYQPASVEEGKELAYPTDGTLFVRRSDGTIEMGWKAKGAPTIDEEGNEQVTVVKGDQEKTISLTELDNLQQEMREFLSEQRHNLGGNALHHIGVEAPDAEQVTRITVIHPDGPEK